MTGFYKGEIKLQPANKPEVKITDEIKKEFLKRSPINDEMKSFLYHGDEMFKGLKSYVSYGNANRDKIYLAETLT